MFKNEAAKFVYYRTYSRWQDSLNRRENWEETVDRVINFLKEERKDKVPKKVFRKLKEYMLNFEVLPSMRLVWSAGEAAKRDNTVMYNCAFIGVDSVKSFSECLYILCCGTGVGYSVEQHYIDKLPIVSKLSFETIDHTVEDSKEGWANAVELLMDSLYKGKTVNFDYSKIRAKGTRLKTMGGRASGSEPLIVLNSYIKDVFNKAQGRKLTSLECSDIMNEIAQVVVVAGVRRSSQICLSDLNDDEMRVAKQWPMPTRRYMANHSAVYLNKPTAAEFLKEWSNLALSGTGERGICNLMTARNLAPKRRNKELISGFNPCVTGDTLILTDQGYQPIESLVDNSVNIWNGFEWSSVIPKVTGTNQEILKIKFSDGRELKCTPYHKFHITKDYSGGVEIIEACELKLNDKLIKHKFPILVTGTKGQFNCYAQGFKSAEGMDDYNFLHLYETKYMCSERLGNTRPLKNYRTTIKVDAPFPKNYVPFNLCLEDRLNWLAGLFDGDGCELKEGGLQLSSVDKEFLTQLQNLLSTLGIQSKVVPGMPAGYRELPDGKGSMAKFWCSESSRICIGATQMQQLKELGLKCERLLFNKFPQRDASQFVKVISIEEVGKVDKVYCFNEPKNHTGIFNGIITGQCHEIALRDKQFCNLTTLIVNENDDLDSLLEKVECASWLGTIQASFTNFPYLRKKWKLNCEEESLLGVSISGQMDNPKILTDDALRALKSRAIKVNKKAAKLLGISEAAAITTVKPEGTTSQLTASGSGLHTWYAPYFIRRYRISDNDPLCKMLKDQGVQMTPENGQNKDFCNTWVISFPMKAPKTAVFRSDMTAIQQLEWYKKVQNNWCEHNASCTIYTKNSEWFEVGNWVYTNWDCVVGVSFLPYDGGKYEQAPYEEITEDQYNKLLSKFPAIDYSFLSKYELEDSTDGAKTFSCVGDKCEI